jgi:hypothetical protein
MRPVSERVFNPEVLRGVEKISQRSLDTIGPLMPAFLAPPAADSPVGQARGSTQHREREHQLADVLLHQGVNGGVRLSHSPTTGIGPVP